MYRIGIHEHHEQHPRAFSAPMRLGPVVMAVLPRMAVLPALIFFLLRKGRKMANKTEVVSGGVGPCFLLFCVFLVLRLNHVIEWSWWWVTAPLWPPLAVLLSIFAGILLVGIIVAVLSR